MLQIQKQIIFYLFVWLKSSAISSVQKGSRNPSGPFVKILFILAKDAEIQKEICTKCSFNSSKWDKRRHIYFMPCPIFSFSKQWEEMRPNTDSSKTLSDISTQCSKCAMKQPLIQKGQAGWSEWFVSFLPLPSFYCGGIFQIHILWKEVCSSISHGHTFYAFDSF